MISSPSMPRARVITENVKSFSHRWFSLIDSVLINPAVDALISAHQYIIHGLREYKESERLGQRGQQLDASSSSVPSTNSLRFQKYQHRQSWTEPPRLGSSLSHIVPRYKHTLAPQCRG